MELRQLQYFLAVADNLSFSRAAEALFISQPALSYQIAELERELSTVLFVRDKRRVFLTPEGEALIGPCQDILERSNGLSMLARRVTAGGERGVLCLGFDSTEDHFEVLGVTQRIARFGEKYPGVEFENFHGPFPECTDQVLIGDLDAAFLITRHNETLPPALEGKDIFHSRLWLVVRDSCAANTLEDVIRSHELMLVDEKPRGNSRILRTLKDLGLQPNIHRVESITSAFIYVEMGRGCMVTSETFLKSHQYQHLRVLNIPSEAADIRHTIVWSKGKCTPLLQKLIAEFDT